MRLPFARLALVSGLALLLAACASGPVRRISEPSAQIQQLTVRADGRWDVELRLNNFSSIPMRFDTVRLGLTVAGERAGELASSPAVSVGPESADVITVSMRPDAGAKIAVADALAGGRSAAYALKGSLVATPDAGSQRTFEVERESSLSPAPGLPGVLR